MTNPDPFHPLFEQAIREKQIDDKGERLNAFNEPLYHLIFVQWLEEMYGDGLNEENWNITNLYTCLKRHYKEKTDAKIQHEKNIRKAYKKTGRPLPNVIWAWIKQKDNYTLSISIWAGIISTALLILKLIELYC